MKGNRKEKRKQYIAAYREDAMQFAWQNELCIEICGEKVPRDSPFSRCPGCRKRRRKYHAKYRRSAKGKRTFRRCTKRLRHIRMRFGKCGEHNCERPCLRCSKRRAKRTKFSATGIAVRHCSACGSTEHNRNSARCPLRFRAGSIDELAASRPGSWL